MIRLGMSLVLVAVALSPLSAQVKVLGPPAEPEIVWLKPPMVLEAAMPAAEVTTERSGWRGVATTLDFTGYAVGGVRLDRLDLEYVGRKDGCEVVVVTHALVEAGHDKEIRLFFEALRGEESVWTFETGEWNIDGGESAVRRWTVGRAVGADRCRELAEGDGLVLQVTYRVANDI